MNTDDGKVDWTGCIIKSQGWRKFISMIKACSKVRAHVLPNIEWRCEKRLLYDETHLVNVVASHVEYLAQSNARKKKVDAG